MNKKARIKLYRGLLNALAILAILFVLKLMVGCSDGRYTRMELDENLKPKAIVQAEWSQCFMGRKADSVYLDIDGEKKKLIIGQPESKPDTEAIEAAGHLAGEIAGTALKAAAGL